MSMRRRRLCRILLLAGILAAGVASSACQTYVGVGVGYGYPGPWGGGPWIGGYGGRPIYR